MSWEKDRTAISGSAGEGAAGMLQEIGSQERVIHLNLESGTKDDAMFLEVIFAGAETAIALSLAAVHYVVYVSKVLQGWEETRTWWMDGWMDGLGLGIEKRSKVEKRACEYL